MTSETLPVPEYQFNMSLAETISFTESVLKAMESLLAYTNYEAVNSCGKQLQHLHFKSANYLQDIVNCMLRMNAPTLIAKLLVKGMALDPLSVGQELWSGVYYLFQAAWNYSDVSFPFATKLGQTELPNLLQETVCNESYRTNLKNNVIHYLIKASLSIIHNIIRVPGNAHLFSSRQKLKDSIVTYSAMKEVEFISCVATLCLAYIVNENERNLLEKASNSIVSILKYIDNASKVTNGKRRFSGFSVVELLAALAALTVNDSVNKAVINNHGITLLKSLCNVENVEELEYATKILWNLLFDKVNREFIRSSEKIEEFLVQLNERIVSAENISAAVGKNIDGCLWMLRGEQQRPKTARTRGDATQSVKEDDARSVTSLPEVFLSYSWSQKVTVLKIFHLLREHKISCWIDSENMEGSTLDAMAEGIEAAKVVLICYSEEYHSSPNCRMEAEYAMSKNKKIIPLSMQYKYKPNGWLGIILGTKLYYDFSGKKAPFEQSFKGFLEALMKLLSPPGHKHLKAEAHKTEEDVTETEITVAHSYRVNTVPSLRKFHSRSSIMGLSQCIKPEVLQWSCDEVMKWLESQGLSNLQTNFDGMNGSKFGRFVYLRKEAPEYFYRLLDDKFQLSLLQMMTFCETVENCLMLALTDDD